MNETGLKQATKHLFYHKHQTPEAKHRRGKKRANNEAESKKASSKLRAYKNGIKPNASIPLARLVFFVFCVCVGVGVGAKCGTKRKCGNRYARWQATRQNSEASPGGRVDRTASRHPTLVPAVRVREGCCPPAGRCRRQRVTQRHCSSEAWKTRAVHHTTHSKQA